MNSVDAEWCGMCLRRFPPRDVMVDPIESPADILLSDQPVSALTSEVATPDTEAETKQGPATDRSLQPKKSGAFTVTEAGISWTCNQCETKNPLEAQYCSVCGTTFAEVVRPKPERPPRDPNLAALLSLFFPGAGHAYVGLIGQAVARGVISVWVVSVVILSIVAGGKSGSNSLAIVFGVVATMLWMLAAHDAYREARGESAMVLLKGKFFLYLVLGLLMLLFAMLVGAGLSARA